MQVGRTVAGSASCRVGRAGVAPRGAGVQQAIYFNSKENKTLKKNKKLLSLFSIFLRTKYDFGTSKNQLSYDGRDSIYNNLKYQIKGFPGGSDGKESSSMHEAWVQSLGWEEPLALAFCRGP